MARSTPPMTDWWRSLRRSWRPWSASKIKLSVAGLDLYAVAGLDLPFEQIGGQGIEQQILDRALERAGAELRVVTFAGEQLPRARFQRERNLLLREPLLETAQLDVHDAQDLFLVEAVEDDDVVHAIEKLGTELSAQFGAHLLLK